MATFQGRFKLAQKTAANWTSDNTVLLLGEIGYETDTGFYKIGDGSTAWNSITAYYKAMPAVLSAIAALTPSNDDILQRKSGAWTNRTPAQLKTDLALVKGDVGLGNVDNTSDATKNAAAVTLTNKTLTSPVINTPTADIITSLTAETAADNADLIMVYDSSATALRKMTRSNFLLGLGGMSIGGAVASGTPGSFLMVDSSGNLYQDNTNSFWDAGNLVARFTKLQVSTDTNGKLVFGSVEADWGGMWTGGVTPSNSNYTIYSSQTSSGGWLIFRTPRYMDFIAGSSRYLRLQEGDGVLGVGLGYNTAPKASVNVHVKPATSAYNGIVISQAGSQSANLLEFRQPDESTVIGGFNKDAALLAPKVVTPKTANYTVTVQESGSVFTNEGTTAKRDFTLPSAAAGLTYTFIVQDADGLRVVAGAGDTIRIGAGVSAAAGNADSATIGNVLTLVALNATEWFAAYSIGTWTLT